ncbi:Ig-like domain-containing protein [Geopsychrobacter electrodiphilus]|uniref:Ig-like domain-containing protein n=1 Tax=Geopsychrobacter electrodiphilus TaxID=225196 RepID=UPI001FDFEACA|nr:Ig-like domain-containing protein [Geopsychrobacter electrodiphilus]
MKSLLLLLVMLALVGCARPPEQIYTHPKTGKADLTVDLGECAAVADRFGFINMSPVHNYPMADMKDYFQRKKVFNFCMLKKGYERGESITVDETTTSVIVADSFLTTGETSLVTISFNTAVGGLEKSDLTVTNGTLSEVKTTDRGLTWTAILTPTPGVEAANNVIALDNSGVINAVSNPGSGITYSNPYSIDSLRPTVAININPTALGSASVDFATTDISVANGTYSSIVNFIFSEAPVDFSESDISVANGVIGSLVKDDATHYHATFTAAKNFVGRGSITVNAAKFTDAARNENAAAIPVSVAIDTLHPTITAYR